MNDKKVRELLGELYWKGHSDGQIIGYSGTPTDFGRASITIESIALQLGCKPNVNVEPELPKETK